MVEAVDVALRDGSTVHVRPVCADDEPALTAFLGGLSDQSLYYRFFTGAANVERAARDAAHLAGATGHGLVALAGRPERIVGHAEYFACGGGRAELAFEVAEDRRGHGIATLLLVELADQAVADGIATFTAIVLPENRPILDVFRHSGFSVEVSAQPGGLAVDMPTELTAEGRARFEDQLRSAAVAAVAHVLRPGSVAVVGASDRPGTIGRAVFAKLVEARFTGRIAAVNRHGGPVHGLAAHRSVGEVPWPVELAVLCVPAGAVADVARDCGEAGVRALVVLTAGFAEVGEAGRRRQDELLRVCRDYGMRLVGPNCLGVLCTDEAVRLNATFAPGVP